ncbi:hypothetical protein BZA70DRAFT_279198 [Myxozyma melibiosi]|uniref:Secreted protein n=1 Tax=Myxozyma melibiosi TaxID=54550 RepID=A0ABR1F5N3_9ASCO
MELKRKSASRLCCLILFVLDSIRIVSLILMDCYSGQRINIFLETMIVFAARNHLCAAPDLNVIQPLTKSD